MKKKDVLEIIEREVPTTWLHPLLKPLLLKNTLKNTREIENLLRNIKNNLIRRIKDAKGLNNGEKNGN